MSAPILVGIKFRGAGKQSGKKTKKRLPRTYYVCVVQGLWPMTVGAKGSCGIGASESKIEWEMTGEAIAGDQLWGSHCMSVSAEKETTGGQNLRHSPKAESRRAKVRGTAPCGSGSEAGYLGTPSAVGRLWSFKYKVMTFQKSPHSPCHLCTDVTCKVSPIVSASPEHVT